MLNELFPDAKNVGLVYCSAEANSQYQVDTVKAALEKLGYTCEYYAFSDSNDLSSVATTAATESDVIYLPTDNTVASKMPIEYAPQFTKEYNPEICKELGIEVPDDYVAIGADAEEETSEDDADAADDTAEKTTEEAE